MIKYEFQYICIQLRNSNNDHFKYQIGNLESKKLLPVLDIKNQ